MKTLLYKISIFALTALILLTTSGFVYINHVCRMTSLDNKYKLFSNHNCCCSMKAEERVCKLSSENIEKTSNPFSDQNINQAKCCYSEILYLKLNTKFFETEKVHLNLNFTSVFYIDFETVFSTNTQSCVNAKKWLYPPPHSTLRCQSPDKLCVFLI
jgi:hypothetical protein